jgi:AP2 domain
MCFFVILESHHTIRRPFPLALRPVDHFSSGALEKMTRATSGHKGISRIDHEAKHTHGWYVRVCFDRQMHSKFFSDASNGGKEKALKKAVKYRNELEKQLGKPRTDRIIVVSNTRNMTGVIGIQRTIKQTKLKDGEVLAGAVYEVTWSPEPNALRKTSFSIEKYGEEGAFLKAVELRQKMEKKTYGRVIQTQIPPFEEVKARLDANQLTSTGRKKKKKAAK